jgi:hypothetical protein
VKDELAVIIVVEGGSQPHLPARCNWRRTVWCYLSRNPLAEIDSLSCNFVACPESNIQ